MGRKWYSNILCWFTSENDWECPNCHEVIAEGVNPIITQPNRWYRDCFLPDTQRRNRLCMRERRTLTKQVLVVYYDVRATFVKSLITDQCVHCCPISINILYSKSNKDREKRCWKDLDAELNLVFRILSSVRMFVFPFLFYKLLLCLFWMLEDEPPLQITISWLMKACGWWNINGSSSVISSK